jgi:hypothetical protein
LHPFILIVRFFTIPFVYQYLLGFDLVFGLVFVVLTQRSLFLFNILFLITGPIAVTLLHSSRCPDKACPTVIPDKWTIGCEQRKFWVSFVVGLALQLVLGLLFMKINPFVRRVHSLSIANTDAFLLRSFIRILTWFLDPTFPLHI